LDEIRINLGKYNAPIIPTRSVIENIWKPISDEDDWQLFNDFLKDLFQVI
jgi:hypothetical protein